VVEQDISLPRLYLAYRTPPYGTDEFYAAAVAAHILAWGKASRLYRSLVREQRLAQDVVAYAFPIVVGASMLVLWATARPGVEPATLEAALLEEIAALATVSDADVERAVQLLEARRLVDLQRVDERADQLSMYATLFDDPGRINTEIAHIRAVTPAAVRDFARRYLADDNRAALQYLPRRKGGAA
jgi:predicted Zn-dependent peptidase